METTVLACVGVINLLLLLIPEVLLILTIVANILPHTLANKSHLLSNLVITEITTQEEENNLPTTNPKLQCFMWYVVTQIIQSLLLSLGFLLPNKLPILYLNKSVLVKIIFAEWILTIVIYLIRRLIPYYLCFVQNLLAYKNLKLESRWLDNSPLRLTYKPTIKLVESCFTNIMLASFAIGLFEYILINILSH